MQTISSDIMIIGSGVGGSAVATQLAGVGIKILILERGDFLPNEPQNSDAEAVFVQSRYKRVTSGWMQRERPTGLVSIITLAGIPSSMALPCSAFGKMILPRHRWMG